MGAPTSETRTGGGRHVAFFTIDADGNVGASPVLMVDRVISAGLPRDGATGYINPSIKQDGDDDPIKDFIKKYAPQPATAQGEVKYNDGFTEGGATGDGDPLLAVVLGAKSSKSKKRKLTSVQGRLSPDSGSTSEDAETRTSPTIEFKGAKITEKAITFNAADIWPDIFDAAVPDCVLDSGLVSDWFFRDNV
jgi:hypothetical protein